MLNPLVAMVILHRSVNKTPSIVLQPIPSRLLFRGQTKDGRCVTCKGGDSPLDVTGALNATRMLSKEERRAGDEDDSGDGENGENTVPD